MAQLADQYREARMVRAAALEHNKDDENSGDGTADRSVSGDRGGQGSNTQKQQ